MILLNNDVEADREFVREMLAGIRKHQKLLFLFGTASEYAEAGVDR